MPTKVLRLMSKGGRGCYHAHYNCEIADDVSAAFDLISQFFPDKSDFRPAPWNDAELSEMWNRLDSAGLTQHFKFGFKDKEQLLQWFELGELEILEMAGIYLYEVTAETVVRGEHQAIFRSPIKEERLPLEALLE